MTEPIATRMPMSTATPMPMTAAAGIAAAVAMPISVDAPGPISIPMPVATPIPTPMSLTSSKPEGFQSYLNPYSSESPSLAQAHKFLLGKVSTVPIINEPFQSSLNPYTPSSDLSQAKEFILEKNKLIQKVTNINSL
jgi:hypothetical protein